MSTAAARGAVPVLMYHAVDARPGRAVRRLSVDPGALDDQLALLAAHGFTTVAFADLLAARDGAALPARPVVLTFDDGYADFHRHALPVLHRHRAAATVFVTTGWLADAGRDAAGAPLAPTMSWSQVRECADEGVDIGAHGHSHAALDQLRPEALAQELDRSRGLLGARLGRDVAHLAYPFGHDSARVRAAARRAGYSGAAVVGNAVSGPADDPWAVPRLTVDRDTDPARFVRVVRGEGLGRAYWRQRVLTSGFAVVRRARAATGLRAP